MTTTHTTLQSKDLTYGQVVGQVDCDNCGDRHPAEFSHEGQFDQGPIFAVVCTADWLTDYYRASAVIR